MKRSGSTRKKLRQDWNRLSALGAVDVVNDRDATMCRARSRRFSPWNRRAGRARGHRIAVRATDAAFVRRLIGDLAGGRQCVGGAAARRRPADRRAGAAVLRNHGLHLEDGIRRRLRQVFAGRVLIDKITEELFATAGIEAIESCSSKAASWSALAGRREMADLLVESRAGAVAQLLGGGRPPVGLRPAPVATRSYQDLVTSCARQKR